MYILTLKTKISFSDKFNTEIKIGNSIINNFIKFIENLLSINEK